MANEQNLRPGEYKLSVEEAKKGGINSGKARRQSKTLAQIRDMIGGLNIKSEKNRAILRDAGITDEDMINAYEKMYYDSNFRENCIKKGINRANLFGWDKCAQQILDFIQEIS